MIFSRDFKWKKPPEPSIIRDAPGKSTKRIIFVRHGESEWNEIFNRGFGPKFFFRLIRGIIRELLLLPTRDSVFVDASLCEEGMKQVLHLNEFLSQPPDEKNPSKEAIEILRGDRGVGNSIIVSSNLRRAIATAALGFQYRLQQTKEQIYILSCLQEISRNVDANALAKPTEVPDLHVINKKMFNGFTPSDVFNASLNEGQKSFLKSNGFKRMKDFCDWCFSQQKETIIVGGGHSFYFRAFFRCFLDHDGPHIATENIMKNGAVISFTLESVKEKGTNYRIPSESLREIFSGDPHEEGAFKIAKSKK